MPRGLVTRPASFVHVANPRPAAENGEHSRVVCDENRAHAALHGQIPAYLCITCICIRKKKASKRTDRAASCTTPLAAFVAHSSTSCHLRHPLTITAHHDGPHSLLRVIYTRESRTEADTRKPRRQNATPCAAEIRHDRRRRLAAVVAVVLVVAGSHGVSADSLSIYIVGSFSPAHLQYRPRTGGGRRSRRGGQLPRAKGRSNHTASAPPVLHLLLRFLPADRTLACRTAPAHAREWGSSTAWRHEMPESLPLSPWCPAPAAKRTRGEPRPRPSGSLARSPIPNPRRRASGGFSSRVDLAGAI